jgi:hypothetical protein
MNGFRKPGQKENSSVFNIITHAKALFTNAPMQQEAPRESNFKRNDFGERHPLRTCS